MRNRPRRSLFRPAHCTLLGGWLCAQGCGFSQYQVNELADELRGTSDAGAALAQLEALEPPQRDRGLYLLSQGQLKLLTGDFNGSVIALEAAKQHLKTLQALSFSETLGASTVNETLRAYAATPGERVLLQELLALNYLMLGQPDAARVEILQADVLMGQLAEDDANQGQVASTRYLSGFIFELHQEWDDALISYRKAAAILDQRGQPLPPALQQSLLQLTARNGLSEEYERYRQRFGVAAELPLPQHGDIVLVYWHGQVSQLQQRFISVYAPELNQQISLAMPYFPGLPSGTVNASLEIGKQRRTTVAIEDIDRLARYDLDQREAAIIAASMVRIVAKQQAVRAAQRDSPQLGALLNLTTLLSEIADLRSWNMLPSSIQVARIRAPEGDHAITLNAGAWHRIIPVSVSQHRPCLILAIETSRQVFNQACRPATHPSTRHTQ